MLTLDLGVGIVSGAGTDSVPVHSVRVIPGTILVEFEFYSRFRWNHCMNLAGPSAKFDSYGIPGIDRILLDSGRNQWRTVKTSLFEPEFYIVRMYLIMFLSILVVGLCS